MHPWRALKGSPGESHRLRCLGVEGEEGGELPLLIPLGPEWGALEAPPVPGSPMPGPSAQGFGTMGHFLSTQLPESCRERKDQETMSVSPYFTVSLCPQISLANIRKLFPPKTTLPDSTSELFLQSALNRPPPLLYSPHAQQQLPASPCPTHPSKVTRQP